MYGSVLAPPLGLLHNSLYGCTAVAGSAQSEAQASASRHMLKTISERLVGDAPDLPEAARLLLGHRLDNYLGDGSKVVPYNEMLVSLPESNRSPVSLSVVLSEPLQQVFQECVMLADHDVCRANLSSAPAQGYQDVRLRGSRRLRVELYQRLAACGIVSPVRNMKSTVTAFFVEKKGGGNSG